ncbi:MAG: DUF3857 and transglutaminase domain-containing protein, partial [Candidatus Omnitrophica bacterium]|nr:DUF3857 and transglutaminase domain-containing protein [Candidatus Omnitrophota bacterium]
MQKKYRVPEIFLVAFLFVVACNPSGHDAFSVYQRACARYEERLAREPANDDIRLEAAQFFWRFHDYQKVKALTEGLTAQPLRALYAKAAFHLKDFADALNVFEKVGKLDDSEYMYLYGATLEEKNLFPKAIAVYRNVKPPYDVAARERIAKIGISVEGVIPSELAALLAEKEQFIAAITKEEAVIVLADESIEVKDDDTAVSTLYIVQKVLRESGKGLAEVEIGYDSTDERVELEYARTITSQGSVVYAGKENIRDVSKYLNFPLYSNARALIISMPSVDTGAIIEYKAKIYSSRLVAKSNFSLLYHARERFPVARARFRLSVPKKTTVQIEQRNQEYAGGLALEPVVVQGSEGTVYTWSFENIAPILPETGMPPLPKVNPAIGITSFSSWNQVYAWWYNLYKDKIALNDEMKKFLATLLRDCPDARARARAIYEFCARDIRYVAVEYGDSGYEPHRAIDIFANRYGDCKDKATLLVALLKEAGFTAYPVLIPTREVYAIHEDFPTVNFNHAIAALSLEGQLIFMDTTSSTTSFGDLPSGDQDRLVLVCMDEGHQIARTPLIRTNEVTYDTRMDIDADENARITRTVTTTGSFSAAQRFYFTNTHPQNIEDGFKDRIVQINPSGKLRDYSVENLKDYNKPMAVRYSFDAQKLLNPADNMRILSALGDISFDVGFVSKETRVFPI